jgi:hypothetical protein
MKIWMFVTLLLISNNCISCFIGDPNTYPEIEQSVEYYPVLSLDDSGDIAKYMVTIRTQLQLGAASFTKFELIIDTEDSWLVVPIEWESEAQLAVSQFFISPKTKANVIINYGGSCGPFKTIPISI